MLCYPCYVVVLVKENLLTALTCRTWHKNVHFVKAKLRSSSWWIRYFVQNRLEENEAASKKFEQASAKRSYKSACQVFHLKSHHWKLKHHIFSTRRVNLYSVEITRPNFVIFLSVYLLRKLDCMIWFHHFVFI